MAFRAPNSNLGPLSEAWGRHVQGEAESANTRATRLGGTLGNDGSVQGGQMDVLAGQINELLARSSSIISIPSFTTPGYTTNLIDSSATVEVPRPKDAARNAWLSLSTVPIQNSTYDSAVFITMLLNGVAFYRQSLNLPAGLAPPPGWSGASSTGYVSYVAPADAPTLLTIQIQARGFLGDPPRTTSLTSIQGSVAFAQKA